MLLVPLRVDQLKFNHTWMYNIINGIIIAPSYLKSENSIAGHTGRDQARQIWPNSGGGGCRGPAKILRIQFNSCSYFRQESIFRGVPRIWQGGGKNFFCSDLEISMSQGDMLRMAKPCALIGGFGGMPPEKIF